MKAVYISEPGGPEKLIYGNRPDPEAGPGEVVVRVRDTAINPADISPHRQAGAASVVRTPHPRLL